jgi:hypothetical protein
MNTYLVDSNKVRISEAEIVNIVIEFLSDGRSMSECRADISSPSTTWRPMIWGGCWRRRRTKCERAKWSSAHTCGFERSSEEFWRINR